MKSIQELRDALHETAGAALLQEEPYIVVAPKTIESAVDCIKTARDYSYRVMVLGSGSSFPTDFTLLRDNVIALLMVRLTGMQPRSPFTVRVLCGTPVATIVNDCDLPARKTLGGLIADARGLNEPVLRAIWPRIRSLDVMTGEGNLHAFPAADAATFRDNASAALFLGSRGKMGWIASADVMIPLPISAGTGEVSNAGLQNSAVGEAAFRGGDLRALFDEHSLFQW